MNTDILVPIDFSRYSISAMKAAVELARKSKGAIYLLHVVEPEIDNQQFYEGTYSPAELKEKTLIAKEKIKEFATKDFLFDIDVKTEVIVGEVYYKIIEFEQSHNIEQIVMGYYGESGGNNLKPGINTELVSLGTNSSVVTTKGEDMGTNSKHPEESILTTK